MVTSSTLGFDQVDYKYAGASEPSLINVSACFSSNSVAILGPNGAGKSTMLSLLATSRTPRSGACLVGGVPVSRGDAYRRALGIVPQDLRIDGDYSCYEFLYYVAWLRRVPRKAVRRRIQESLETVSLTDSAHTRIKKLSGGMRQRLGLAQALVNNPSIVLLDEPTNGLDPAQRAQFRDHITKIQERTLVVTATHLIEDVAQIAREVLILGDGRKVFAGTLQDLCGVPSGSAIASSELEAAYLRAVASRTGPS